MNVRDEQLETIACEIDKRPRGAPSFFDLADALRGVRREGATLTVEYDASAAASLDALVDAERRCCPEIGFAVEREPLLQLRITAAPGQLDVFEEFLRG